MLVIGAGIAAAAALVIARRHRSDPDTALTATGVVTRNAQLAAVGARSGASYAVHRARLATTPEAQREALATAYQMRTATQVADALGNMKGALMKIGQMASYLDDGLPEPVREALAALQQDAPPMSAELTAEVVRAELGGDPARVFAEWDPEPIAAASIGQVHRAVTHSGIAVAVKVQYPGVDEAIRADLVNTDLLFRVLGMMFPGLDPGPLVDELRERLTEELDVFGLVTLDEAEVEERHVPPGPEQVIAGMRIAVEGVQLVDAAEHESVDRLAREISFGL